VKQHFVLVGHVTRYHGPLPDQLLFTDKHVYTAKLNYYVTRVFINELLDKISAISNTSDALRSSRVSRAENIKSFDRTPCTTNYLCKFRPGQSRCMETRAVQVYGRPELPITNQRIKLFH
jgi:hypothetical protein